MGLTQDELDRRRQYLTATDVPRILGRSPWGNAADVFLEKVHGRISGDNDAMRAGTLLEPAVIAWAHEQLGGVIAGDWRVHENGINACSLDGVTLSGEPVEAKTSGIVGPGNPHQWGAALTDEIPEYYLLQVHAQLLVTGAKRAFVPALIGGRGFVMYVVEANQRVSDSIQRVSEQFWEESVQSQQMPEGKVPTLDTLKRIRREPGSSVQLPIELVERYLRAKANETAAKDAAKMVQAELLSAIGTAEAGVWDGGVITYYEQTRKAYSVPESTFRTIHVNSKKEATR